MKTKGNSIDDFVAEMVKIPSGEIELRDDRTKKSWTAKLEAFWLAKFPMTQDLYFEVMQSNPSTFKSERRPIETISWLEAVIFCNQLSEKQGLISCYNTENIENVVFNPTANGFRLPTEAEWEYACKAGKSGIRYGDLDEIAWYKTNSGGSTQNVGEKLPNLWGLYDMLGNVWEWCNDIYDSEVYGSYRIFRGGGWSDEPRSVMATTRRRSHPMKFKIDDLGFRIAKNLG
jgi:formylglycine-generating enzyme required for sulfatase activity